MGAVENSRAPSVKRGFVEGTFEKCTLYFKKRSLDSSGRLIRTVMMQGE